MVRSKLSDHGGVKAEVVAQLDLDKAAPWSAGLLLRAKLAEVRDLARTLDVHRAIVAPGGSGGGRGRDAQPRAHAEGGGRAGERAAAPAGGGGVLGRVRRSARGDGDGRQALRSHALLGGVKRAFDLLGASIGLLAVSPLMIAFAVAIKLDSRGPVFFRQLRVGRHGKRFTCSSSARWSPTPRR